METIKLRNKINEIKTLKEGLNFTKPGGFIRKDFEEIKALNGIETTLQYCVDNGYVEVIGVEKFIKTVTVYDYWNKEDVEKDIVAKRYTYKFVDNIEEKMNLRLLNVAKYERKDIVNKINECQETLQTLNEALELIKSSNI